jgi:hypothetical protein
MTYQIESYEKWLDILYRAEIERKFDTARANVYVWHGDRDSFDAAVARYKQELKAKLCSRP